MECLFSGFPTLALGILPHSGIGLFNSNSHAKGIGNVFRQCGLNPLEEKQIILSDKSYEDLVEENPELGSFQKFEAQNFTILPDISEDRKIWKNFHQICREAGIHVYESSSEDARTFRASIFIDRRGIISRRGIIEEVGNSLRCKPNLIPCDPMKEVMFFGRKLSYLGASGYFSFKFIFSNGKIYLDEMLTRPEKPEFLMTIAGKLGIRYWHTEDFLNVPSEFSLEALKSEIFRKRDKEPGFGIIPIEFQDSYLSIFFGCVSGPNERNLAEIRRMLSEILGEKNDENENNDL